MQQHERFAFNTPHVNTRGKVRRTTRMRAAWMLHAAAMIGMPMAAMGQGVPARQPLDVNAIRPIQSPKPEAPKKPTDQPASVTPEVTPATPAPTAEEANLPPGTATAEDGQAFRVSRFVLRYQNEHEGHPELADVLDAPVRLGVVSDGYVAPRPGIPSVVIRIGDVAEGAPTLFYQSAINAVRRDIVRALNSYGLIGVFVQIDPDDLDESMGIDQAWKDLRGGTRGDLRMVLWTGKIQSVRTIASGERHEKTPPGEGGRINSPEPVQRRVRERSPLQVGGLVDKITLDDYLAKLNRHPGRRVDVALAPAGGPENPEDVQVDYLVSEMRPWSVYLQVSNTGTKSTNEWRERVGFVHNQLSDNDDILRVDYITAGFDSANAITGSYERPIWGPDVRGKVFASYSQYNASDVGLAGQSFEGETIAGGGEVAWNFYQHREWFVDAIGGARVQNVIVEDSLSVPTIQGDELFVIPYVGLRAERSTEASTTFGSVQLEGNWGDVAGTSARGVDLLGRRNADESWMALKFDASHSFYLEPWLNSAAWGSRGGSGSWQTLAHEVYVGVRGQYSFNYRLVPNEQDVAGGLYTVRGYEESTTAGDTVVIGTMEYRFHYPRTFGVSDPGHLNEKAMTWFGSDFRYAPQTPYGQADWDLIFKGFVDAARVRNNNKLVGEDNNTLIGVGVGAELQFKRNLSLRLDWGLALSDVKESGTDRASAGDSRLHVVFTLLY